MDIEGYLRLGYMVSLLLLGLVVLYRNFRLAKYIFKHYPEEGKVIRSDVGKWYPWCEGQIIKRKLIKERSDSDIELAHRAKQAKLSSTYFLLWFLLGIIELIITILFFS